MLLLMQNKYLSCMCLLTFCEGLAAAQPSLRSWLCAWRQLAMSAELTWGPLLLALTTSIPQQCAARGALTLLVAQGVVRSSVAASRDPDPAGRQAPGNCVQATALHATTGSTMLTHRQQRLAIWHAYVLLLVPVF
jgi:hypothetical protein